MNHLILVLVLTVHTISLMAKEYSVATVPNVRLSNNLEHVSDPDSILSSEAVDQINGLLSALEDSLGIEVAVVAISDIGNVPPREFANALFNYWGIGKAGSDNGLLVQLVVGSGKRSIIFETGYGIKDILPDAICKRIQQRDMIPLLKTGDYSGGMVAGVEAVCQHLYANAEAYNEPVDVDGLMEEIHLLLICVFAGLLGLIILLGFLVWSFCQKNPRRRKEVSSDNHAMDMSYSHPELYSDYHAGRSSWSDDYYNSNSKRNSWGSGWTESSDSGCFGDSWGGGSSGGGGAESDF